MKGKIYVWREGRGMVEVRPVRREQVAPSIRVDTIPTEYCHGTGQYYDSRSRRDMELKAAGVERISMDYKPTHDPHAIDDSDIEADIAKSFNDVAWGNAEPLTQGEQAIANQINKAVDAK